MKETLSIRLFRALLDGKRRLGTDALKRMRHFLADRKSVGEAFMNKGGEPDIYYTSFGWALAYVLGLPLDRELCLGPAARSGTHATLSGIVGSGVDGLGPLCGL